VPRFPGSSAPRRWPSRPFPIQQRQSHLGCPGRRCPGKGTLSGGDCREAAAICTARDDPMPSRAASAASDRSGLVRAMRPRMTRHSSSATAVIASITAAEGASCSSRQQGGSRLAPAHPAERTGRFPGDDTIRVAEQLGQRRNGRRRQTCTAAAAGADLGCLVPKQRHDYTARKTDA